MSEAAEKLARNRQAILDQVARRGRRQQPRDASASSPGGTTGGAVRGGWTGQAQDLLRHWWDGHPARLAFDIAAPVLQAYARRKPGQLVGIALAAGAALTLARPWRLISLTTLALALVKSADLPRLVMAAMAAGDHGRDAHRPEARDPP